MISSIINYWLLFLMSDCKYLISWSVSSWVLYTKYKNKTHPWKYDTCLEPQHTTIFVFTNTACVKTHHFSHHKPPRTLDLHSGDGSLKKTTHPHLIIWKMYFFIIVRLFYHRLWHAERAVEFVVLDIDHFLRSVRP